MCVDLTHNRTPFRSDKTQTQFFWPFGLLAMRQFLGQKRQWYRSFYYQLAIPQFLDHFLGPQCHIIRSKACVSDQIILKDKNIQQDSSVGSALAWYSDHCKSGVCILARAS